MKHRDHVLINVLISKGLLISLLHIQVRKFWELTRTMCYIYILERNCSNPDIISRNDLYIYWMWMTKSHVSQDFNIIISVSPKVTGPSIQVKLAPIIPIFYYSTFLSVYYYYLKVNFNNFILHWRNINKKLPMGAFSKSNK